MICLVSDEYPFTIRIYPNPKAAKVLFYATSYAFPWWVYIIPILRFRRLGYEVIVYDFHDAIIENDDPGILPATIAELLRDMSHRQKAYESKGIKTFHGIGNSLGSYLILNYAIRHEINAVVLNGGGSISDIIFHHNDGSWNKVANTYTKKGYDREKLRELWAEYDLPTLAKNIKAKKVLLTYSLKDGTIPFISSEGFLKALQSSGKQIFTKTDQQPHVISVIKNSHKVKSIHKFLNPT